MQDDFTKLSVAKVDADTGAFVAGATLQIIDKDGNVVYEWVSTNKAHIIERIAQGDYTLHEVKAPAGYELAADVSFSVADSPEVQTVTLEDKPIPTLDKTGRDGSVPVAVIVLLAVLGLSGVVFAFKNLAKKKDGSDGDGQE
jgi:uncharacterized surface anchored protein